MNVLQLAKFYENSKHIVDIFHRTSIGKNYSFQNKKTSSTDE